MQVIVVEDNALLREGLAALLSSSGINVVDTLVDARPLAAAMAGSAVDVVLLDVRLPPTFGDEGIRAALDVRRSHPGTGVLILSQYVELVYTTELLASGSGGVGYLLKERVGDVRGFLEALRRVGAGGTALDGEVVAELLRNRAGRSGTHPGLDALTAREHEVLSLMAEGRSNSAIAAHLVVGAGAVEKHVSSIFAKLELPVATTDHRRVLAVLTYLRAVGEG